MLLSVVIPTHNPRGPYLERVLAALSKQTLPADSWELLIVDNQSQPPVAEEIARRGHPQGRVLRESKVGLTAARLAGFSAARGEIVILVDDDNVLAPDYLRTALTLADTHPTLGTWSGYLELEFEPGVVPPPRRWWGFLAGRTPTAALWSNDINHHDSTPWGAGMCIRRAVVDAYRALLQRETDRAALDLQGKRLVYGGDTDIAYTGCELGFGKGVFPELRMRHLIPPERCTEEYMSRSIEGRGYSQQLHAALRGDPMENPRRSLKRWLGDALHYLSSDRATRVEMSAYRRGRVLAWRELSTGQPPKKR